MHQLYRRPYDPRPSALALAATWFVCGVMLGLLLGTLAGCSKPSGAATFTPAITSPLPVGNVIADAAAWAQRDPGVRYYATVADTHSMEPFFTSKSVPLCLRYTGQPIPNGTVAIFNRGDAPRVIHVVSDQTADSVYMSGYNNHDSDGWFPKTRIEGFVVGQLYAP